MLLNYYAILGITPSASQEEIRTAYRNLMQQYHPDRLTSTQRSNPNIIGRVYEINAAYEVLSNPSARQEYDQIYTRQRHNQLATHTLFVRCATTGRPRLLLMIYERYRSKYLVIGHLEIREQSKLMLPSPRFSIFQNLKKGVGRLFQPADRNSTHPSIGEGKISFRDIDFGTQSCPDCKATIELNGFISTWGRCGHCEFVCCVGNRRKVKQGYSWICPSCKEKRLTTKTVSAVRKGQSLSIGGKSDIRVDERHNPQYLPKDTKE